jgi:hypothetical protein
MSHLAEHLAQNQAAASAAQSKLRAGRRVIRRDLTAPVAETGIVPADLDHDDDSQYPVTALPSEMAPSALPISHVAITVSPLDLPEPEFRSGLDRRKQNRALLMDWLRTALVEGVDFGRVHIAGKDKCEHARAGRVRECTNQWHWSKPSLFKPGAEKISGMLGMTIHYPSLAGYERALLSGMEITQIMLRCELHDAQGRVVAEGVGARNLAQDYGDINKAFKMAEKSAHIDATLRLAGLSEVFTQDLEDRPTGDDADPVPAYTGKPASGTSRSSKPPADNGFSPQRSASPAPASPPPPVSPDVEIIGPDDVQIVLDRIAEIGIAEKRVLAWLNKVTKGAVTRFDQLNVAQCTSLLKRLDLWAQETAQAAA